MTSSNYTPLPVGTGLAINRLRVHIIPAAGLSSTTLGKCFPHNAYVTKQYNWY